MTHAAGNLSETLAGKKLNLLLTHFRKVLRSVFRRSYFARFLTKLFNYNAMPLTAMQVAKEIGFHPVSVSRLCKEGKLRATKVGYHWFIMPSDLEAFKREHSKPGWFTR